MDIQALANALVEAFQKSNSSQIASITNQSNIAQAQINQNNAAAGLLYSTRPRFQRSQYIGNTFAPAITEAQGKTTGNILKTNTSVQDALTKIKAMNDAAAQLDGATF